MNGKLWLKCEKTPLWRQTHFRQFRFDLPTVDANHDHTGEVETDTAGHDGVGGREVQSACGILFAVVLENQRLVGPMDAQGYGHKRDERGQQPNGGNGDDSHASCHPAAVSAKRDLVKIRGLNMGLRLVGDG